MTRLVRKYSPILILSIVVGDHLEKAKILAMELESNGAEVLIDDRDTGFGQKA